MKVIISESQALEIIREQYNDAKYGEYMDTLLDKLSAGQPLTDEEKSDMLKLSHGEDLSEPESEESNDGDDVEHSHGDDVEPSKWEDLMEANHDIFMSKFPNFKEFDVDGETWTVKKELEPNGEFEVLWVSQQNDSIIINPFADNNKFEVVTEDDLLKFTVENIPKTSVEMEKFVNQFITKDLISIVKIIKNKREKQ